MEIPKRTIAIDATGGDHAPAEIVRGALLAAPECASMLELVGEKTVVEGEMERQRQKLRRQLPPNVSIVDAGPPVGMGERVTPQLIRAKRDAPIFLAAKRMAAGKAQAVFSAGSTAAAVAAGRLHLDMLEGIQKPAIGVRLPTPRGTFLIDVGAWPKSDREAERDRTVHPAIDFIQRAVMAEVWMRVVHGVDAPTVRVANVAEEKGGPLLQVHKVLEAARECGLRYLGCTEGDRVWKKENDADIVLADGLLGNWSIKSWRELPGSLAEDLFADLRWYHKLWLAPLMPALRRWKAKFGYEKIGGAPMLGTKGVVVIGHGISSANAVRNALKVTEAALAHDVNPHIESRMREVMEHPRLREMLGNSRTNPRGEIS